MAKENYKFVCAPMMVAYEGYSLDVSITPFGEYLLQPTKFAQVMPRKFWKRFSSKEEAQDYCDEVGGINSVSRLITILEDLGIKKFEGYFN